MPTPSESRVTVSGKPSKAVQLLRKRLRQLLRVVVVLAACVAVAATALAIWWLNSLNGLPDIGDPFDVAAFRAFRRSRRTECLHLSPASVGKAHSHCGDGGREWGRPGRLEVLVVDRESDVAGVGRGESRGVRAVSAGGGTSRRREPGRRSHGQPVLSTGRLITLALLEASRRQESGDTAGAWDCYRAVLRTITHLRRRGSTLQRQNAREASRPLQRRLTDWATEPRTTISQLRTALEVVLENEPKPEWDLFAVKYGYLELMGALERPIPLSALQAIEGEWTFRLGDMSLSPEMVGSSRGRATVPPARARTQPARPAAALCQLPGARGNPRAASRGNRPSWRSSLI